MAVSLAVNKLSKLLHYLDHLTKRAPIEELEQRLKSLELTFEDIAQYAQFDKAHYRRNLVRGTSWYHLLVLCWKSGQRSPIHNHAESTCGLKVLCGIATETKFETTPSSLVKAVSSRDLREGHIAASKTPTSTKSQTCRPMGPN
jgi:cysteine dioxygenase